MFEVLIPSAWHDLVQWNGVIPRVALKHRGQEDHRLVATQVALQPEPRVTLCGILRRPSRYSSSTTVCGAVPPERDATNAVELFSQLARIVLASIAPRFAPGARRPWIRVDMGRSSAAP